MQQALDVVSGLEERAKTASVPGNREYNPGWHTSVDLKHLLTVSRAITLAAIERKESRGGHFRDDYPDKDEAFAKVNTVIRQGTDGQMQIEQLPLAPIPDELQQIIDEEAK